MSVSVTLFHALFICVYLCLSIPCRHLGIFVCKCMSILLCWTLKKKLLRFRSYECRYHTAQVLIHMDAYIPIIQSFVNGSNKCTPYKRNMHPFWSDRNSLTWRIEFSQNLPFAVLHQLKCFRWHLWWECATLNHGLPYIYGKNHWKKSKWHKKQLQLQLDNNNREQEKNETMQCNVMSLEFNLRTTTFSGVNIKTFSIRATVPPPATLRQSIRRWIVIHTIFIYRFVESMNRIREQKHKWINILKMDIFPLKFLYIYFFICGRTLTPMIYFDFSFQKKIKKINGFISTSLDW